MLGVLECLESVTKGKQGTYAVLVVDRASLKLLNATLKMSEILVRNISGESGLSGSGTEEKEGADLGFKTTVVEDVLSQRASHPDLGVVYLLSPLAESVDAMLRDWTGSRLQYLQAHVFFLSGES